MLCGGASTSLKGLWPVDKPLLEQVHPRNYCSSWGTLAGTQEKCEKEETETNHYVLTPTHCAACCLAEEIECNLWQYQERGRELLAVKLILGEKLRLGKWKAKYFNVFLCFPILKSLIIYVNWQ